MITEGDYDPESLLVQSEVDRGLGYKDHRKWPDFQTYVDATNNKFTREEIVQIAPRVKGNKWMFGRPPLPPPPEGVLIVDMFDLATGRVELVF